MAGPSQPHINRVNIWRNGNATSNPPDVTCLGNLIIGKRITETMGTYQMRYLTTPNGTDVRGQFQTTGSDTVEIPAGSRKFYIVVDVDDVGKGTSWGWRQALMLPIAPMPMPPAPPATPCSSSNGTFSLPYLVNTGSVYTYQQGAQNYLIFPCAGVDTFGWQVEVDWTVGNISVEIIPTGTGDLVYTTYTTNIGGAPTTGTTYTIPLFSSDACCASVASSVKVTTGGTQTASVLLVVNGFV